MTREDIMRMAREAGCGWSHNGTEPSLVGEKMLERFAALVAEAEREAMVKADPVSDYLTMSRVNFIRLREADRALAVAAEREAICSLVHGLCVSDNNAQEIVNAIRARGGGAV